MEFIFNSKIYHIMSKLAECMILSILWFVFSLPVITFGASTSALYYSVVKVVRKDEGSALKDFWHSFKSNFKQSIFVSLLALAISILIIAIGSAVYAAMPQGDVLKKIYIAYIILFSSGIAWMHYILSYIARFEASFKTVLTNSLIICLMNLPSSLSMAVLFVGIIVVFIMTAPASGVAIFLLPAIYALITSFMLEKIYQKYMPTTESDQLEES